MTKRQTTYRKQAERRLSNSVPVDVDRVIEIRRAAIHTVKACDGVLGWNTKIERVTESDGGNGNGRQGDGE